MLFYSLGADQQKVGPWIKLRVPNFSSSAKAMQDTKKTKQKKYLQKAMSVTKALAQGFLTFFVAYTL